MILNQFSDFKYFGYYKECEICINYYKTPTILCNTHLASIDLGHIILFYGIGSYVFHSHTDY